MRVLWPPARAWNGTLYDRRSVKTLAYILKTRHNRQGPSCVSRRLTKIHMGMYRAFRPRQSPFPLDPWLPRQPAMGFQRKPADPGPLFYENFLLAGVALKKLSTINTQSTSTKGPKIRAQSATHKYRYRLARPITENRSAVVVKKSCLGPLWCRCLCFLKQGVIVVGATG